MDVAVNIYKAYDIRGVYGSELTELIVYKTARALAQLLQAEQPGKLLTIVLGADMRVSSPALHQHVQQGLSDEGCQVVNVGLVSTPAFYFAVAKYGYDGGIMISASHNPPQYNGLKMVRAGGVPISKDTGIITIRDAVVADTAFGTTKTPGQVSSRDDIVAADVAYALEFCQNQSKIKPFKIVADAANGMGATYLAELFKHLPGQLLPMNFKLDGTFPAHEADPFKAENNRSLMERVVAEQADLGIATDGDGDRIFFIDNEGQLIEPAIIRGLMAQILLQQQPGATICYDIRPGKITYDMIVAAGGKPSVTKVGHSLIKEQAIAEGAIFAGESSGHFFVKMDHGMFEAPCIVTLKLLEYFSAHHGTSADQVRSFRTYFHSGEINSTVRDVSAVMTAITQRYSSAAKAVSQLDGITIEYPNYWFNVRASNTEPLLRLNLEAVSADICATKTAELLAVIRGS
ncbi:MAG: phosphomannomutase/phosphoglucomutase [Candidatus Kerfeldbacteria bacterium]|nr:phosphomannomutase/phosphoglucomutase [Candidatus Kerfeldbacteria bacterium]